MSNPNIKPRFKKGSKEASEAGKKGGARNKGSIHFGTALKKLLKEAELSKRKGDKNYTALALIKAWLKTSKRNPAMAKLVAQLNGELKEKIELTGEDGGPINNKITIEFIKPDGGNEDV